MTTTNFRPSIHGWPFFNAFSYTLPLCGDVFPIGYCGGMCWLALDYFFSAQVVDRALTIPTHGAPLCDAILRQQLASLDAGKVLKIYTWQLKPDLDGGVLDSLGASSQSEWHTIRSSIDSGKPITITLIAHSNDGNVLHMTDNHRVVVYAYEIREPYGEDVEWIHGDRDPSIRHVTLHIYDPNHPNDDAVTLTFYTGCEDSWICLRHHTAQATKRMHGFFVDDRDRSFQRTAPALLKVDECELAGITSAALAECRVKFSWDGKVIPFYEILVNGVSWGYNNFLANTLPPAGSDKPRKQLSAAFGCIQHTLVIPRDLAIVEVRLLDTLNATAVVDAKPAVAFYPFVRTPQQKSLQICDPSITDNDLYVADDSPTDEDIQQQFDPNDPFRWIYRNSVRVSGGSGRIVGWQISKLGNLKVPVFGNLVERNLAAPTQTAGTVEVFEDGNLVSGPTAISPIASSASIFAGFSDSAGSYTRDAKMIFTYTSTDVFGATALSRFILYGRSAIKFAYVTVSPTLSSDLMRMDAIARRLVEIGLVDLAIHFPPKGPRPGPGVFRPDTVMREVHASPVVQGLISAVIKKLLTKQSPIWKEVAAEQAKLSVAGSGTQTDDPPDFLDRELGAIAVDTVAKHAIDALAKDPKVIGLLQGLRR